MKSATCPQVKNKKTSTKSRFFHCRRPESNRATFYKIQYLSHLQVSKILTCAKRVQVIVYTIFLDKLIIPEPSGQHS